MDEASDSDSMAVRFYIGIIGEHQLDTDKVSYGFDGGFSCCVLFTYDRKKVPFIAW